MVNDRNMLTRSIIRCLVMMMLSSAAIPLFPVDSGNAMSLANYALALIRVNDVDGLLEIMDDDLKKDYLPFTPEKRENFLIQVQKEAQLIGEVLTITEIRACTTPRGKPGVAARIRKKKKEVYVLMISEKDGVYFYESIHTLDVKTYKKLTLIEKAE